jgi:hypothetical protein
MVSMLVSSGEDCGFSFHWEPIILIAKQPVFALLLLFLYAACLPDIMDLTRPRLEPTVFSTRNEHANHYIVHAILLTILIIVVHVHAEWANKITSN